MKLRPMALRRINLRPWVLCLSLAAASPMAQPPSGAQLPDLGDSISDTVSLSDERRYGDYIAAEIRGDPASLDDPLLLQYVRGLWRPLVEAARAQGNLTEELWDRFAWEPLLIKERAVNAAAFPGGYFIFNLGLISLSGSRDELAAVMAHELAHATQRHIARGVADEGKGTAIRLLGVLLGALAMAKTGDAGVGYGVMSIAETEAMRRRLSFSRELEREADRVGHGFLVRAGFRSEGMARMFERMEQATHLMDNGAFPYLRTHPLTRERIADARVRVEQDEPQPLPQGAVEHALMAARARVLADSRAEALQAAAQFEAGGRDPDPLAQIAARYGAALAAFKLRQRDRAEASLQVAARLSHALAVAERQQVTRYLAWLRAEGLADLGDGAGSWQALSAYAEDRTYAALMLRAQAVAADGVTAAQRESVLDALQTHLALNPKDALAWERAGRLWAVQGQALRSLRAQAEAHVARGDTRGGLERLRSALRLSRQAGADPIEASVIDARLRAVLYERRRLWSDLYPNRPMPPEFE
ncbi:M48 family metalloprotease [Inhella gelatinilytica]|uniref:M48 family metalloprotease n=1 Tax=Inhella gelatinilytica TaxID=2795030 RepID=A0A931N9W8_9BURK|nr:M48 family metalloprotease [Inhella gelatinilytica]MBH9551823.1 M48 family metalloprotease [Inhella gelatinilytica]